MSTPATLRYVPQKCSGCKKRIPEHEPDYVLEHLDGGHPRYYHEACATKALPLILRAPAVWILTHRSVDEEAN